MNASIWQMGMMVVQIATCIIACITFVRGGRWRQTDEGKALIATVADHGQRLTKVEGRLGSLATRGDVDGVKVRLDAQDLRVNGLATKEGVDVVRAEVRALDKEVTNTARGVDRIEAYMMERNK